MIQIDAREPIAQLGKLRLMASGEQINQAQVRAMNHTVAIVRTRMGREVRKTFNIPVSAANQAIKLVRARNNRPVAFILARGRRLTLAVFKPTEVGPRGRRTFDPKKREYRTGRRSAQRGQGGILVEIYRGKAQLIRSAFFLPNDKAKGVPFSRGQYDSGFNFQPQKDRTPISALTTLSPWVMATNKDVMEVAAGEGQRRLPQRIKHELIQILRKA